MKTIHHFLISLLCYGFFLVPASYPPFFFLKILLFAIGLYHFVKGLFKLYKSTKSSKTSYIPYPESKPWPEMQYTGPKNEIIDGITRVMRSKEIAAAEKIFTVESFNSLTDKLATTTDEEERQVFRYMRDEMERKKELLERARKAALKTKK